MDVTFYTFSKRMNSTAQPTGGTNIDCAMRTGYSDIRPKIEFRGDPRPFNYMKIGNNYYYITDKTFNAEENFFVVEGERDPLATFRSAIFNTVLPILRTSKSGFYADYLQDSLALTYARTGKRALQFGSDLIGDDIVLDRNNQSVVVAIAGTGFRVMSMYSYDQLISNMFYTQEPADEIAKWVMNPSSWYIGQMGFPLKIQAMWENPTSYHPKVAWWVMNDVNTHIPRMRINYSTTVTPILHPQSDGNPDHFLNNPPYMMHTMYVGGFGQIPLDSNKIIAGDPLTVALTIDVASGGARLKVENSWGQVVGYSTAQMGYDIAMASRNPPNIIGAISAPLIGAAVGGAVGAIGGGIAAISQLQSAGGALTSGSTGGAGGWDDIQYSRLECTFKNVAQYDPLKVGRPTDRTVRLDTLEGEYVETLNGTVSCAGTPSEKTFIESKLKGGVYLE